MINLDIGVFKKGMTFENSFNSHNQIDGVCDLLNVSQKRLSEILGVSEGSVNRWHSNPIKIPLSMQKHLSLLAEAHLLRESNEKYDLFFKLFNKLSEGIKG